MINTNQKREHINLQGKKISILGMALSGTALANVLHKMGAEVLVSDVKNDDQLHEIKEKLKGVPLEWETGGHTEKVYKDRDLIVISPGVSIHNQILKNAKEAGVPIISEVEMAYLLTDTPFICITGTNGKSTTSTLIHNSIIADGRTSHLAGNIGIPLVGELDYINKNEWVVAEISSFQLEAVNEFHPKIAVLTNITNDHIDRHGSFEAYAEAKGHLFRRQTGEDYAVLNSDDPAAMSIAGRISSKKLFFSRRHSVEEGAYYEDGFIKTRFGGKEKIFFKWSDVPVKGVHNLENVLAVSCVCLAAGIKPESLFKALHEFKPLHYRMEYVDQIDGKEFYNDSKGTNPDAVRASLESFDKPVVIIAGGTDKGLDFGPLANHIKKYASGAVLIGESRKKIAGALEAAGFDNYTISEDLTLDGFKQAIKTAWEMCPPGGVVLLSPSCASFDMFKRAEHRGEMFNIYVGEIKSENEKI